MPRPKCRAPDKAVYPSRSAALKAIARGAHGNSIYYCPCKRWHTTSQVRSKPRGARR